MRQTCRWRPHLPLTPVTEDGKDPAWIRCTSNATAKGGSGLAAGLVLSDLQFKSVPPAWAR